MGSALSWALYCSLLRLKDRRIPANGFVAVSSLLGALILLPIVAFWLMRHPAQTGQPARAVFPQRPGVSGNFPIVAGLFVLEQRYRHHWRHAGRNLHPHHPLSGGVLSILFLHTQPHARHLFSALFIMVGIGICSLEKRRAASIRLRD